VSAQRECHGSYLPHQFDVLIFQVSLLRIGGKKWIEKHFAMKHLQKNNLQHEDFAAPKLPRAHTGSVW